MSIRDFPQKIYPSIDNFIDNFLQPFNKALSEPLHKMNVTPNMVTTFGLVVGLAAVYAVLKEKYFVAFVLFWLYYFGDCLDGYMARKYDQATDFGDKYDHARDVVVNFSMFIATIYKAKTKAFVAIYLSAISVVVFLSCIHMGFQEQYSHYASKGNDHLLGMLKNITGDNISDIHCSKFFGTGTLVLVQSFFILLLSTS